MAGLYARLRAPPHGHDLADRRGVVGGARVQRAQVEVVMARRALVDAGDEGVEPAAAPVDLHDVAGRDALGGAAPRTGLWPLVVGRRELEQAVHRRRDARRRIGRPARQPAATASATASQTRRCGATFASRRVRTTISVVPADPRPWSSAERRPARSWTARWCKPKRAAAAAGSSSVGVATWCS